MFLRGLLVVVLWFVGLGVNASPTESRLVVGITVSRFYPEWLDMYRNDLSEGGLKRLMAHGQRVSADYGYFYSQTGVDHASIYSGLLPAEHGIVAHDWFDRLKGRRQHCVTVDGYREIGVDGGEKGGSPEFLQALTLGCSMKMNNLFAKVYSVSMNADEAILSGGSCADLAIWFNEKSGVWVSSSFYQDSIPGWLKQYNSRIESDFFVRRGWMPLASEVSNNLALKLKSKVGLNSDFFFDIAQAKRRFNTYRVLKATPYANSMVTDVAMKLVEECGVGKDNDTDLLALSFSCLDYMNRDFDVMSKEFYDVLMRLDRDVERLLTMLDTKVGKGSYTVFMTFSEARELMPEELGRMRLNAGYFSVFKAVALLKSYLNLVYGDGEWILDYDGGQLFLNRELIDRRKLSLREVQDKVADFMVEFEGVSKVLTSYALTHSAYPEGINSLVQGSFSQRRSGDILFTLQPTWVPELKDIEDSYLRYSKRSRVPVYFYGAGVGEFATTECRMVDVLPTVCRIAGVVVPYTAQGECLLK